MSATDDDEERQRKKALQAHRVMVNRANMQENLREMEAMDVHSALGNARKAFMNKEQEGGADPPDWACDRIHQNPMQAMIDFDADGEPPKNKEEFGLTASAFCNRYYKCYGTRGDCIHAVTPDRFKNRVRQHTTSKKVKKHKKRHRHGGKRKSKRTKRMARRSFRRTRRKRGGESECEDDDDCDHLDNETHTGKCVQNGQGEGECTQQSNTQTQGHGGRRRRKSRRKKSKRRRRKRKRTKKKKRRRRRK